MGLRSPLSPYDWDVWFLAWGIAFPEVGAGWSDAQPPLPSRTYAFLCLCTEDQRRSLPALSRNALWRLGSRWSVSALSANSLIKSEPMIDFDPDPDRLAQDMTAWIRASAEELRRVISDIVREGQTPTGHP